MSNYLIFFLFNTVKKTINLILKKLHYLCTILRPELNNTIDGFLTPKLRLIFNKLSNVWICQISRYKSFIFRLEQWLQFNNELELYGTNPDCENLTVFALSKQNESSIYSKKLIGVANFNINDRGIISQEAIGTAENCKTALTILIRKQNY